MFSADDLKLDAEQEVARICAAIRRQVRETLRKRGAVVGLSGGVDSSVVVALCARALGADNVLGLFMPERHSSDDALWLGHAAAAHAGVSTVLEDITGALEGAGCYARQEEAISRVVPEFGAGWRFKLVLPSLLESERLNVTRLVVQSPEGETRTLRLPPKAYLQLVAATNFKQRTRTMMEYYHADRLNYAVAGTPNRLELDQGFFVKQGDGTADFKPIAHLFKTQVYQLAEHLGVPEAIRSRPPTADTFSLPQTQEEFYFSLPYRSMDLCLYAHEHRIPADAAAAVIGITAEQVQRAYRDIESKRRATRHLHLPALLVSPVPSIGESEPALRAAHRPS